MLIHWQESATTKTAPFRRNPLGAGGFGPQALSLVGRDAKTAPAASVSNLGGRSSLRACNPKTPARGPRDFRHGLLTGSPPRQLCIQTFTNNSQVAVDGIRIYIRMRITRSSQSQCAGLLRFLIVQRTDRQEDIHIGLRSNVPQTIDRSSIGSQGFLVT